MARAKKLTRKRTKRVFKRPALKKRVFKKKALKFSKKRLRKRFKRSAKLTAFPKSMTIKSKNTLTLGEFIHWSHPYAAKGLYDCIAQPTRTEAVPVADSFPTLAGKEQVAQLRFKQETIWSTDYLQHLHDIDPASHPIRYHDVPILPQFNAFNPYIRPSIMGPNWATYVNYYKYYKIKGWKVKWIPNLRAPAFSRAPPMYISDFVERGTTEKPILHIHGINEQPSSIGYIAVGTQTIGQVTGTIGEANVAIGNQMQGTLSQRNLYLKQPEGYLDTKYGINSVPSDSSDILDRWQLSPSIKMHVLFEKDGYVHHPLPFDYFDYDPTSAKEFLKAFNENTLFKFLPYDKVQQQNKNYKVYNMNKPFSFYVKPYEQSAAQEANSKDKKSATQLSSAIVNDGDNFYHKHHRLGWMETDPKKLLYPVPDQENAATIEELDISKLKLINAVAEDDANFLNPILFGFFFTADGLPIWNALQAVSSVQGGEDGHIETHERMKARFAVFKQYLSSIGHFEITPYVSFKGLKSVPTSFVADPKPQ